MDINERKMDVICKLNNIASAVCKMKDEKKFKKIETHVKKLNSTVERKKTVRKSPRKKKTMSKSMSMSHLSEPDLDTSKYDSIDNTNLPGTAPVVASSPSFDFLEPSRDRMMGESEQVPPESDQELSEPVEAPSEPVEAPSEPVEAPGLDEVKSETVKEQLYDPDKGPDLLPEQSNLMGGSLSRRFY